VAEIRAEEAVRFRLLSGSRGGGDGPPVDDQLEAGREIPVLVGEGGFARNHVVARWESEAFEDLPAGVVEDGPVADVGNRPHVARPGWSCWTGVALRPLRACRSLRAGRTLWLTREAEAGDVGAMTELAGCWLRTRG